MYNTHAFFIRKGDNMKINFLKSNSIQIISPVNGVSYPIEKVRDETFSQKMLGPGLAICTYDSLLVSPVNGVIRVIANTKHAYMIESNNIELLIHIGIDTCNYSGEGFETLVNLNQKVKIGDPIVKIDHVFFQNKEINSDVIMVFTNIKNKEITIQTELEVVKCKSIVATIQR